MSKGDHLLTENCDESLDGQDMRPCWRCHRNVPTADAKCPHCGARLLRTTGDPAPPVELSSASAQLTKVLIWSYALLLAIGVIHAFVLGFRFGGHEVMDAATSEQILNQVLFVEGIDTLIVLLALVMVGRFSWSIFLGTPRMNPIVMWIAAIATLGCLLGANVAYNWLLREITHSPLLHDELSDPSNAWCLLAICVQPAIVEEAYCRGLAFIVLRRYMGVHATVWVSATMFAMLHVAEPLSMPFLFLVGAWLGYVRHLSGGIWLPMFLHFAHNFVVMTLNAQ